MAFESEKILTGVLDKLIHAAGFNLAEFSREVDISREALRGYTSKSAEVVPIKPENLRIIAAKLGVSINVLRPPAVGWVSIVVPQDVYDALTEKAAKENHTIESLLAVIGKSPDIIGPYQTNPATQADAGKKSKRKRNRRKKA